MVTKAIQSYADSIDAFPDSQLVIQALAEDIAPHIIESLGLTQVWASGWIGADGGIDLDSDDDTDRDSIVEQVARDKSRDVVEEGLYGPLDGDHYLVTRLLTDYVVDELPVVDEELAELASQEL